MSHSFSITSVRNMEPYLDANVKILRRKLVEHARHGNPFDLTKAIHYYVIDVLGELAFGQSFGIQESGDESLVPPVKEHSLLAAAIGSWPVMTATLKRWLPMVPAPALQRLYAGRAAVVKTASSCVRERMSALRDEKDDESASQRKDILTSLILAKDPDTGARLTEADLRTEAFGFM